MLASWTDAALDLGPYPPGLASLYAQGRDYHDTVKPRLKRVLRWLLEQAPGAQGKVFVTTEIGGGGTATAASTRIALRGARNVLRHAGILRGEIEGAEDSVMLDMPGDDCFHFAERDGLLHPLVDLGEEVAEGQPIARIWPADRTGVAPMEMQAHRPGIIAARHFPGLVQSGDCLAVIATRA